MRAAWLFVLTVGWSVAAAGPASIDRVLGSIDVGPGQVVGDVTTVNGSIDIAGGAIVAVAKTVNGHIKLSSGARAASLTTVNGDVTLESNSNVAGQASTVNGALKLGRGAEVGGELRNVNGAVSIDGAHLVGRLRTSTGSIELTGGARLDGGIFVDHNDNNWGLFTWGTPRIVIGPGTQVGGPLKFERKVTLFISDRAVVTGPIDGATPTRFSGDKPPG